MRVIFDVTNPVEREHTMTKRHDKSEAGEIKALLTADGDFLRSVVQSAVQAALEAEMTEALSADRSERVGERRGYRSGSYSRSLITRAGTIELRVPRDRTGLFSTELFERYQRSEKALVSALAEMYVQGVSTRKVKAVTETLCGHSFSASAISGMNRTLDAALTAFASRRLEEPYPYLILDARYERVREGGVIASHRVAIRRWQARQRRAAVLVAVDGEGRRQIWALIWPTGKAHRVGGSFCCD
jgi:putative transposase